MRLGAILAFLAAPNAAPKLLSTSPTTHSSLRKGAMRIRFKTTIQRETRRDKVDWSEQILKSKQFTLVVESQLYTAGSLVSFDAYTIGKLPNHKGR